MSTTNDNLVVEPYLFFEGRCEEAIEFYRSGLGAEVGGACALQGQPGASQRSVRARFREQGDARELAHRPNDLLRLTDVARECRVSKASRWHSGCAPRPRRSGCSPPWQRGDRCECRWPRRSFRRASAWLPTASGCYGWSSWQLEESRPKKTTGPPAARRGRWRSDRHERPRLPKLLDPSDGNRTIRGEDRTIIG